MPSDFPSLLALAGQILLGGFFIIAAIRNVMNWQNVRTAMATGPLPNPEMVGIVGITMQAVSGLSVFFNLWPAIGAAVAIAFLILASVMFHPFWKYQGAERAAHLYPCLANAAMAGGMLMVAARALGG